MDPRIGQLNGGRFYAYVHGNGKAPFFGTLGEVEEALGLPRTPESIAARSSQKTYSVVLRFQYPAWDEAEGIEYAGIEADTKAQANASARRMADSDGHLCGGKGRVTFTAHEQYPCL